MQVAGKDHAFAAVGARALAGGVYHKGIRRVQAVHVIGRNGADGDGIVGIYLAGAENVHPYAFVVRSRERGEYHHVYRVDAYLLGQEYIVIGVFVEPCGDVHEHRQTEGVVAVAVRDKNSRKTVHGYAARTHNIDHGSARIDKVSFASDLKQSCGAVTIG